MNQLQCLNTLLEFVRDAEARGTELSRDMRRALKVAEKRAAVLRARHERMAASRARRAALAEEEGAALVDYYKEPATWA